MKNPFQFGRELAPPDLVDRQEEIAACVRTVQNRERLFLIGPRRYGKTSILKAASETLLQSGAIIFRYSAEAYPTIEMMVARLVADATEKLAGSYEKATGKVRKFFARLRPEVTFSVMDRTWSATLGVASQAPGQQTQLLVDGLGGVERLAADASAPVGIMLDEFQHLIELGGRSAEGQLRAAVQEHASLGYIFAGSKTRTLTDMTSDASRPFYRLGERLFVGPIPRKDFQDFLQHGFAHAGFKVTEGSPAAILDSAEEVPYNVQMLAHACWNELALARPGNALTAAIVRQVLDKVVRQDDPFYTQVWNALTSAQQKAMLALVREKGQNLHSARVVRESSLSQSTMQRALAALKSRDLIREEETRGQTRLRLEDPFFGVWLGLIGHT
jgi:uncharacterized protein